MSVIDKIDSKLNEVTMKRIDFNVQSMGTQSLVKIWMGVYTDTSIKELQQAEKVVLKRQAAMVKTIETMAKRLNRNWRPEPQKTAWVQTKDDTPVATPLLLTAYITIYNTEGTNDTSTLFHILDKHRG